MFPSTIVYLDYPFNDLTIHCISEELGVGLPGLRRHRNEAALQKKSFVNFSMGRGFVLKRGCILLVLGLAQLVGSGRLFIPVDLARSMSYSMYYNLTAISTTYT